MWSLNQVYGGGGGGSNFDSFDGNLYGSPYYSSLNLDCFEYECKPFSDINIGYMNFQNNNNNYFERNLMLGSSSSNNNQMLNQEEAEIKPTAVAGAVMMNLDELNLYNNNNNNHQCDQYYLESSNNNTHLSTRRSGLMAPATATRKIWKGRKKNNVVKGQWTVNEDRILVQLVERYGIRKWSHIAQMLSGRIGKQCRERWHNHLKPDIKDTWTEEEDKVLIQSHAEIKNKWAEIAKSLPGRTENSIKNHWNATKRRLYSKGKCRSKYPCGSILQDYIKSLNLDTSAAANNLIASKRSSSSSTIPNKANSSLLLDDQYPQHNLSENDRLVPTFYYNNEEVPDFGFDGCNLDSLLDGLPPIVDGKGFDDLDVSIDDQQALIVAPSLRDDFEVEKELDLVEMMSVIKKLGFF